MPRQSSIGTELSKLINKLREERTSLLAKLQEIDSLCDKLGISKDLITAAPVRRTRTPRAEKTGKPAGRRSRGSFAKTGEESVFDIVKNANHPLSAAEVNKKWRAEGRGGKADNTLGNLVTKGKLKRLPAEPGERGGKYTVA